MYADIFRKDLHRWPRDVVLRGAKTHLAALHELQAGQERDEAIQELTDFVKEIEAERD